MRIRVPSTPLEIIDENGHSGPRDDSRNDSNPKLRALALAQAALVLLRSDPRNAERLLSDLVGLLERKSGQQRPPALPSDPEPD